MATYCILRVSKSKHGAATITTAATTTIPVTTATAVTAAATAVATGPVGYSQGFSIPIRSMLALSRLNITLHHMFACLTRPPPPPVRTLTLLSTAIVISR